MNTSYIKFLSSSAILVLAAMGAQAQDLKIGFFNSDRFLRDSSFAIAAQAKLEAEFSKREKELNDLGNRLKAASDRFEKDAPTLSETERARRQRELIDQDREFQRKRREFQEDLTQRKGEEQSYLLDRASKVIKQIHETEKYDIILNQDGVVFFSSRVDITEKVIKALSSQGGK